MEVKFYHCETCGNLLFATFASGVTPECCGQEMTELKANEQEGVGEKHLPEVELLDCCTMRIKVGSILHPASKEHGIRFVGLVTSRAVVFRYLEDDEVPDIVMRFDGKPKAVFAYCNLHGLWCKDLKDCKVKKTPWC